MTRQAGIGRAELEILRYVADHHPVTSREVADHIAQTKGHTRSTVVNVMERLRAKGYLTREPGEKGVFRYSPSAPKARLLQNLVRDFVDQMLGGSLQPFVTYLAEDAQVSDDELRDLKRLVEALDQERRGGGGAAQ